jgi:transposase
MKPISLDLRKRIIAAYESGEGSQEEIAARFGVSYGFVKKLWRRWCDSGDLTPSQMGGFRKPAFDKQALKRLRQALRDHPDATLDELAEMCDVSCSRATVYNTLNREGYRRKKNATRR